GTGGDRGGVVTQNEDSYDHQLRAVNAEVTRRPASAGEQDTRSNGNGRARVRRLTRQAPGERAGRALTSGVQVLDAPVEDEILRRGVARGCGLGPLEGLLENPEIENLNLTGTTVWVRYADGTRANLPPIVDSPEELVALVRRIAADSPAGERRFDAAAPILDMPLTDGSRLNAI